MFIHDAFTGIQDFAKTGFELACQPKQTAISFLKNCHTLRNNTDFFEKIGQVAYAAIQLVMMHFPGTQYLSRLSFAFSTVLMHDFYSFLKQPTKWFYPLNLSRIDQNAALTDLTTTLQEQLDPTGAHGDVVQRLARAHLEYRFQVMGENNDTYRSVDEFKEVLQKQIRETKNKVILEKIAPATIPATFNLEAVSLTKFHMTLTHVPLLERLGNLTWILVDVGTVGYFFQKWNLLDTAKWGERIGKVPGFQWVPSNSFDTWVIGGVCTGFGLKLVEAVRKLYDEAEAMTTEQKRQARWDVVTSIAEGIFYGAIFMNRIGQCAIKDSNIQWLAIIAKSLGLLSIIRTLEPSTGKKQPDTQFFQPKTAPAA